MRKVYVEVLLRVMRDGSPRPVEIVWEDGRSYEVQRVLQIVRAAATKAGGQGTRYTVEIGGRQRYLFEDMDRKWFVEAR